MAKCIKRAGIVFFVIAVSSLIILCSIFSLDIVSKDSFGLDNNIVADNDIESRINYTPDYTLQGDTAQMATIWNTAIQDSISQKVQKTVLLNTDWIASNTTNNPFGSGIGFTSGSGAITIPTGANIVLDLNGHLIDKHTDKRIVNGSCFMLRSGGSFTLKDSGFDKQLLFQTYEDNKVKSLTEQIAELKKLPFGRITGGACNSQGGGIYCDADSELNINGVMIIDNIFAPSGGAIYSFSKVTINGGLFMNNNATDSQGGALRLSGESVISDAIILGNTAKNGAGGVFVTGNDSFKMTNCIVSDNTTIGDNGGGFYISGSNIKNLSKVVISNNKSNVHGGGMYLADATEIKLSNCTLTNNNSKNSGGGIYTIGKINAINCTIDNNTAELSGGGIFFSIDSTGVLNNCEINDNNANQYGGGLYAHDRSICVVNDSNLENNIASFGGGIAFNNKVILTNTGITNNTALSSNGGVALGNNGRLIVSGATIIKDNKLNGINCNIALHGNSKIEIDGALKTNSEKAYISLSLSDDYNIFEPFTLGYTYNGNSGISPDEYFYCDTSAKKAIIKNNEVVFNYYNDSVYDFVYLENGLRKNYKENEKVHNYNDNNINTLDGKSRFVLGNISTNTSINQFIANLASLGIDSNNMQLYDSNDKLIYQNGAPQNGITTELLNNRFEMAVGTGWYIVANGETIYLSVLGDINGDGRISASDCSYLREIANDKELYDNLDIEIKLASLIINKGSVTTADSEILIGIMDYKLRIELFY